MVGVNSVNACSLPISGTKKHPRWTVYAIILVMCFIASACSSTNSLIKRGRGDLYIMGTLRDGMGVSKVYSNTFNHIAVHDKNTTLTWAPAYDARRDCFYFLYSSSPARDQDTFLMSMPNSKDKRPIPIFKWRNSAFGCPFPIREYHDQYLSSSGWILLDRKCNYIYYVKQINYSDVEPSGLYRFSIEDRAEELVVPGSYRVSRRAAWCNDNELLIMRSDNSSVFDPLVRLNIVNEDIVVVEDKITQFALSPSGDNLYYERQIISREVRPKGPRVRYERFLATGPDFAERKQVRFKQDISTPAIALIDEDKLICERPEPTIFGFYSGLWKPFPHVELCVYDFSSDRSRSLPIPRFSDFYVIEVP